MSCLSLDCDENIYQGNICQNYTLISNDRTQIMVNKDYLKNSEVLKVCLEDKDNNSIELAYPTIILEYISKYLEIIHNNPPKTISKPIIDITLKSIVNEPELNFINEITGKKLLSEMVHASNYLYIQPLLNLCCAKIASLIRNKSKEEIVQIMNSI